MKEKRDILKNKRLAKLARWGKRLEKKHKKVMGKVGSLNRDYERFFVECKKIAPELDTIEAEQANLLLEDLRNTFELDL